MNGLFEGLTIVLRAFMVAGIPVAAGFIYAEILDMLDVWKKEDRKEWKR